MIRAISTTKKASWSLIQIELSWIHLIVQQICAIIETQIKNQSSPCYLWLGKTNTLEYWKGRNILVGITFSIIFSVIILLTMPVYNMVDVAWKIKSKDTGTLLQSYLVINN